MKSLKCAALGFLLLFSACTAGGNVESRTVESAAPINASPAVQIDHQAMEKYLYAADYPESISQVYTREIQTCLSSQGISNTPESELKLPEYISLRDLLKPKPLSIEQARNYGYIDKTSSNLKKEQETPILDEKVKIALYGDGSSKESYDSACVARSAANVFGSIELHDSFVNFPKRAYSYVKEVANDKSLDELNSLWSQCMKDKYGLEYEYPQNAGSQELAIQDASCRENVMYEEKYTAVINSYLTTFFEKEQGLLENVAQARKNAENKANNLQRK